SEAAKCGYSDQGSILVLLAGGRKLKAPSVRPIRGEGRGPACARREFAPARQDASSRARAAGREARDLRDLGVVAAIRAGVDLRVQGATTRPCGSRSGERTHRASSPRRCAPCPSQIPPEVTRLQPGGSAQ